MICRQWEAKGVAFGCQAMTVAKRFGGTVTDAEWIQYILVRAFEEGVRWEGIRQKELLKSKKKAKP